MNDDDINEKIERAAYEIFCAGALAGRAKPNPDNVFLAFDTLYGLQEFHKEWKKWKTEHLPQLCAEPQEEPGGECDFSMGVEPPSSVDTAQAVVKSQDEHWYSYHEDLGIVYHSTSKEARDCAELSIFEEACSSDTSWGKVVERVVEVEVKTAGYELTPVDPPMTVT